MPDPFKLSKKASFVGLQIKKKLYTDKKIIIYASQVVMKNKLFLKFFNICLTAIYQYIYYLLASS